MTRTIRVGFIAAAALAAACGGGGGTDQTVARPAVASALAGEILDAATVRLTWIDDATTETGYRVERSENGGAFAAIGLELAPDSTSYVDATCAAGTTYEYRVATLGRGGTVRTPPVTVPFLVASDPSGGVATATSSSTIHVAWTNNATDALSYTVYRSTDGTSFSPVATLDGLTPSTWDDSGRSASTLYYYRVTATNLVGESSGYASCSATTQPPPIVLPDAAPTGLAIGTVGYSSVSLTWSCAATNEDGFKLYWSTVNSKPSSTSFTAAANATGGSVTGLSPSTTYYFWVTAYNVVGDSAAAGSVTTTTLQPLPAAPTGFAAAAYKPPLGTVYTGIRFTWTDASSNEDGFRVYGMAYDATLGCAYKGTWTLLGTAVANANTLTWDFPRGGAYTTGQKACFRMASYNGSGSSYASVIPFTMPK